MLSQDLDSHVDEIDDIAWSDMDFWLIRDTGTVRNMLLTSEGAFSVHGLSFDDDSVIWSVLINGYLELDQSITRPVMKAEQFLTFLRTREFVDGFHPDAETASRLLATCHYLIAYYASFSQKRNTLIGYVRLLCRMANSVFEQLLMLRHMGECHDNVNLRVVFDMLRNPISEGTVKNAYSTEDLYEHYCSRVGFVSKALCDCHKCARVIPDAIAGTRMPWLYGNYSVTATAGAESAGRVRRRRRCGTAVTDTPDGLNVSGIRRARRIGAMGSDIAYRSNVSARYGLHGSVAYLSESPSFPPMYLPNIVHVDDTSRDVMLRELSTDLMQSYVYGAVDSGRLLISLDNDSAGRGLLERIVLNLVYNVCFVLFLISTVRRLIAFEIDLLAQEFVLQGVRMCRILDEYTNPGITLRCMVDRVRNRPNELPGMANLAIRLLRNYSTDSSRSGSNRARVILEHLCLMSSRRCVRRRFEIVLAQQLRHLVLSEYGVVDFSRLRERPELSMITEVILCASDGMMMFKSPLWFAYGPGSDVVSDVVSRAADRHRARSASEENALRERIRRRRRYDNTFLVTA
ncbi:GP30 [Caviid betaherpesvirus 2]|uniref:GP30 n=2 Tax=Caviid betaherpesvirus 2 TaxID=33706 RepID=U6H6M9_9BETA|nr:GP30 [Caviid betaherpesvirus 2]AGE11508.1 GP30 [Caviid betaherpesvirus 2]AIL83896.1 GP30 [BAC cloning vector GPN13BACdenovo_preserved(MM)]BAJ78498.1 GP30 [Caviid betaherpesvirus 2]CDI95374.1 GP30 [Caviid herpesvirus 2 str. CIDMTR]